MPRKGQKVRCEVNLKQSTELHELRRKGATDREIWLWAAQSEKNRETFLLVYKTDRIPWEKVFPPFIEKTIVSWRISSRKVIRYVLENSKAHNVKQLTREISKAYPFGPKKHWPYKIWLEECKWQFRGKYKKLTKKEKLELVQEGQKELF